MIYEQYAIRNNLGLLPPVQGPIIDLDSRSKKKYDAYDEETERSEEQFDGMSDEDGDEISDNWDKKSRIRRTRSKASNTDDDNSGSSEEICIKNQSPKSRKRIKKRKNSVKKSDTDNLDDLLL